MSDEATRTVNTATSSLLEVAGTPYLYESVQEETLRETDRKVEELRKQGALSEHVLQRIRQYFKIKNIYHSNAIEGNQLDVGETRQVVEYGLTITGKSLRDQAEAKNLSQAVDYLEDLARNRETPITEKDVRQIHTLVLKGINDENAGKYRDRDVEISGSAYKPPGAESVSLEMDEFGRWLSKISSEAAAPESPVIIASLAHAWFVRIHPFIDGNGRVARLLMNLILMRAGFPIAIITREDRQRYYDALEESQAGDISALVALVCECVDEALEEYLEAVQEHREEVEWAQSIAQAFTERERSKARNEYEVWKAAMDLLKSHFRQTAELLDESATFGQVYFKDFGTLEFEKYASLRDGTSAKRTWFFRVDFRSGERAARYLFFFGYPSHELRNECDVTAHLAREERPYFFERLDHLNAPDVPSLLEIGYRPDEERFIVRLKGHVTQRKKVEDLSRGLIEEVIRLHF